jgi:hypothetical protein
VIPALWYSYSYVGLERSSAVCITMVTDKNNQYPANSKTKDTIHK